jgi:hypothetical protein
MQKLAPLAAVVLAAQAAGASPEYPTAIGEHLALLYNPPCSLCHVEAKTGPGTGETPFARSARAHGLEAGDIRLVSIALDALAQDGTDSDRDGIADIQELLAGTDPNVSGGRSIERREDPQSGCSSAGAGWGWVSLLALHLFARRKAKASSARNAAAPTPSDAQPELPPLPPPPPPPPPP